MRKRFGEPTEAAPKPTQPKRKAHARVIVINPDTPNGLQGHWIAGPQAREWNIASRLNERFGGE